MNKAIVTTTINPPTKALEKFLAIAKRDDWKLFIVGDKKTPHEKYRDLEKKNPGLIIYIDPDHQEAMAPELSKVIGWNCIQRRNFGLITAYNQDADIIATVDDDNIPNDNWGQNLAIGKDVDIDLYRYKADVGPEYIVFDPLAPTTHGPNFWHRGFPIQLLKQRCRIDLVDKGNVRKALIQADLWDGAPDIDAVCRINKPGNIKFNIKKFYAGEKPGPFNSQNTFLAREVIPHYFMWPHIGRMDDIFAAYYVQARFPNSVVYGPASVFQERNPHDLSKDLEAEMIGYKHALDFAGSMQQTPDIIPDYIPFESLKAFRLYREALKVADPNDLSVPHDPGN